MTKSTLCAAGVLSNAEVAVGVMGLAFQISSLLYMVPLGLSSAANTRVAIELGAGRPKTTRHVVILSFFCALLLQVRPPADSFNDLLLPDSIDDC